MEILKAIRTRFGSGLPDSQGLTQALGEVNRKINALDATIAQRKADLLAFDEAADRDASHTTRDNLRALRVERKKLVERVNDLRARIAGAREAEGRPSKQEPKPSGEKAA